MSDTIRHDRPCTGLPRLAHGTALPAPDEIDVTTLRGRRAVRRWERTCAGDVLERLTWSRPDQVVLRGMPGAHGEERFAAVTAREGDAVANRFAHALLSAGPPATWCCWCARTRSRPGRRRDGHDRWRAGRRVTVVR